MKQAGIGIHLNKMPTSFNIKKMKQAKSLLVKVFIVFFIVSNIISPTIAFAASDTDGSDAQGLAEYNAAQAKLQGQYNDGSNNGASGGTASLQGIGGASLGAVGTCSIGAILGRFLSSAIGSLVNTVVGKIKGFVTDTVDEVISIFTVPTSDTKTQKNTAAPSIKTTGIGHASTTGLLDWVGNISLDSIMFCIVNEIMTYITQSTIQWINSGFNGNPVFVQNTGAMFQQIANREASNFTREVANGAQQAASQTINTTVNGIKNTSYKVAAPFRKGVFNAIAGDQTYTSPPPMTNLLTQNFTSYTGGNYYAAGGGRAGLADVALNNQWTNNWDAKNVVQMRTAQSQQIQQNMIQDGTRSFTKCRAGAAKGADGNCDPKDLQVTTPGKEINDESSFRQNMKYTRLAMAQNFDSVVTALVNQLVKIAINKVYESVQN
ncbi:MAG: hypothetical protein JWP09_576 [Candidatus Taylorbacteria bacterium]|nr:hypothetical protein [Candidatus Taylorbacteria bacterium]